MNIFRKIFRKKSPPITISVRNINEIMASLKFKLGKKRKVGAEIIDLNK